MINDNIEEPTPIINAVVTNVKGKHIEYGLVIGAKMYVFLAPRHVAAEIAGATVAKLAEPHFVEQVSNGYVRKKPAAQK